MGVLLVHNQQGRQELRERSSLERLQWAWQELGKTVDQKALTNRDRDTRIQDGISVIARVVHQAALIVIVQKLIVEKLIVDKLYKWSNVEAHKITCNLKNIIK